MCPLLVANFLFALLQGVICWKQSFFFYLSVAHSFLCSTKWRKDCCCHLNRTHLYPNSCHRRRSNIDMPYLTAWHIRTLSWNTFTSASRHRSWPRKMFFLILLSLFIILSVITIAFALTTILVHWKSRCRSISHLLNCNSCAALLYHAIATTIGISFIIDRDVDETISTSTSCEIRAFVYFSSGSAMAYSYFITTLQQYKSLITFRINWILIRANWALSGFLATLMFLSSTAYQYEWESRMCLLTSKAFTSSFLGIM